MGRVLGDDLPRRRAPGSRSGKVRPVELVDQSVAEQAGLLCNAGRAKYNARPDEVLE